jgi:hypothetical protein
MKLTFIPAAYFFFDWNLPASTFHSTTIMLTKARITDVTNVCRKEMAEDLDTQSICKCGVDDLKNTVEKLMQRDRTYRNDIVLLVIKLVHLEN